MSETDNKPNRWQYLWRRWWYVISLTPWRKSRQEKPTDKRDDESKHWIYREDI